MNNQEQQRMRQLARAVDKVCFLILRQGYPQIDIEIAKNNVRILAQELFPEKMELFELIYESRWNRLEEQFRGNEGF